MAAQPGQLYIILVPAGDAGKELPEHDCIVCCMCRVVWLLGSGWVHVLGFVCTVSLSCSRWCTGQMTVSRIYRGWSCEGGGVHWCSHSGSKPGSLRAWSWCTWSSIARAHYFFTWWQRGHVPLPRNWYEWSDSSRQSLHAILLRASAIHLLHWGAPS